MNPVTFQINTTAGDYRHSQYLLKHQIELFHDQVGEILITYDSNPKKKITSTEVGDYHNKMLRLIDDLKKYYHKINFQRVDYTPEAQKKVTLSFFNKLIPLHDFRGAPIYAYYYGIYQAKYDYVFHIDSDMFFGGLSKTWISEAIDIMNQDEKVLVVSPLPGPPHPEKLLLGQRDFRLLDANTHAYMFRQVSTRVFMINRKKIFKNLRPLKPVVKHRILAYLEGFSDIQTLEMMITAFMKEKGYYRIDFLGKGPGLWTLHPNYRSSDFYRQIPDIIERIKKMDIPSEQYGHYNLTDNFIDWGEGIENFKKNRLRNRLLKKIGLKTYKPVEQL